MIQCVICRHEADIFLPYGTGSRANARCPACGSLERHRLLFHYMKNKTDLLCPQPHRQELIHFAPEKCFLRYFNDQPSLNYHTADLYSSKAIFRLDITDIACHDNSFDCIICCHVLEHIEDDLKAMSELRRVLKPNGTAFVQVPLLSGKTYEDFSISSEAERVKYFGQKDHVRWYDLDITERFEKVGFVVLRENYITEFTKEQVIRNGFMLNRHQNIDDIFVLKKH